MFRPSGHKPTLPPTPVGEFTIGIISAARRKPAQDQTVSANLPIFTLSGFSADDNPEKRFELCARFKKEPLSTMAGQRAGG